MTTKTKKPLEKPTANDLKREAEDWLDRTFNFIQLEVFEDVAEKEGTQLIEQVRSKEIDWEDIADYAGHYGDKKWIKAQSKEYPDIEDHPNYDDVRDQLQNDNYPMWNTLFEFRNKPGDKVIEAAIEAGLGVIEAFGPFNTALFATSAGHSFYSAYWIPLYLSLPWNDDVREKYKGVKYNMV